MNDKYDGCLLVYFRIDNETIDFAIAIFYFHPLPMSWRFCQAVLGPILNRFWRVRTGIRVMMRTHALCGDAVYKYSHCHKRQYDSGQKSFGASTPASVL